VRTWTPRAGHFTGFCITHSEAIALADYYTVRDGAQGSPSADGCTTAYHPCDSAITSIHELVGRNYVQQERQRILMDDITQGIDELGVLLAGHKKNAYWYGSQLSTEEARKLAPLQQRHQPAGDFGCSVRCCLGNGKSQLRHRRAGRDRFSAAASNLHALPRPGRGGNTPTGPRCTSASVCFRKTSTRAIPGSLTTSG